MYTITTTKAIVLKSHDTGERDLFMSLFTKDLGQIYARVSGVRDMKSKHRYSLQEYSLVDISLVKGKTGWRITNTGFIKSFYFETLDENKREIILKILTLVKRFYLGEEPSGKIFDDLLEGFEKIEKAKDPEEIELLEAKTVLQFLYDLGYVEDQYQTKNIIELRKIINNSLRSSDL